MYWQQRYLKESRQLESYATGLETIDLPQTGLLSGLELRFWGAPPAAATKPDCWIHDRLKKIELVVGGEKPLKSLDGAQLLADMLYKKTPHYSHDMKNVNGSSAEEFFYINLGRFYHDLDYMLDLSRVSNPQLRLEYDFSMTSHDGWSNGIAYTAAPYYSLLPHILREPDFTPKGFIKTAEVYRFTSGASKKENMKLPIGPQYANLYLQCFYASHGLSGDLDKVELNINNDKIIPWRVGVQELASELARRYGLFSLLQQAYIVGGQAYPHPLELGKLEGLFGGGVDLEVCRMDLWAHVTGIQCRLTSTGAASTNGGCATLEYKGILPFSVAAIPIFDLMDERTWINSSGLGDLWLRVEEVAGAASSVVKLLADTVVTSY